MANGTCTQQLCVYTLSQSTLRFEPFVGLIKVRTRWDLKSWLCTECTQYTLYNIHYTGVWGNLVELALYRVFTVGCPNFALKNVSLRSET